MFDKLGAMMSLLGNRGKMQEEAQKFRAVVDNLLVDGTAGGGMVTVKVNGQMQVLACRLSDEALKLNDREMLEDLIVAAANQAIGKVREQIAAETAKMAANMGLPPGMLGGLGLG